MPPKGALAILADSPDHEKTAEVLFRCWDWTASPEQLDIVHRLVLSVFSRSAGIIAVVIAAIAKRTGRLQPALGGVSVALSGILATNKSYQNLVRSQLDTLFQRNTTDLIQFIDVADAPAKGAAVLAYKVKHNQI